MLKNIVSFKKSAFMLSLFAITLLTNKDVSARGTFHPVDNSGQCKLANGTVDTNVLTGAVVRKAQDVFFFSMKTTGVNSVGDWSIRFALNSALQTPMAFSFPPPGSWLVTGAQVNKANKGTYTFTSEATNVTPKGAAGGENAGEVCTVTLTIKI